MSDTDQVQTQSSDRDQVLANAVKSAAANASPAGAVVMILIALAVITLIPQLRPNWGTIGWAQQESVTVVGYAQSREANEIAMFSVSVSEVDPDKDLAVTKANTEVTEILSLVESFGIPKEDIKTQNVSVYRMDEGFYPERMEMTDEVRWQASTTIEVYLRDLEKVSEFTNILARSNASNFYGPQLMLDPTNRAQDLLIEDAMTDARAKAETLAKASGRSLGKVVNVIEGGSGHYDVYPMYAAERGSAGGFPIEPGTSSVSKSVTVTFALR